MMFLGRWAWVICFDSVSVWGGTAVVVGSGPAFFVRWGNRGESLRRDRALVYPAGFAE